MIKIKQTFNSSYKTISITKSQYYIRLVVDGKMKINVKNFKIPEHSKATIEQINTQKFIGKLYKLYLKSNINLVNDVIELLERIS